MLQTGGRGHLNRHVSVGRPSRFRRLWWLQRRRAAGERDVSLMFGLVAEARAASRRNSNTRPISARAQRLAMRFAGPFFVEEGLADLREVVFAPGGRNA
jgi:hypothetical protein